MRVLIACEYSGSVRDAFRALGHDAMSCDLLPTDVPGPHHQGDVRDVLDDVVDEVKGFFEVHAENYMVDGGPFLRHLQRNKCLLPISKAGNQHRQSQVVKPWHCFLPILRHRHRLRNRGHHQ